MTAKKGNGYEGKSMSRNARIAYAYDEMPKSKWTKSAILQFLEESDRQDLVDKAKALPISVLRNYLNQEGYHHTGAFYSMTKFYTFNISLFENATTEEINEEIMREQKRNAMKAWKTNDISNLTWKGEEMPKNAITVGRVEYDSNSGALVFLNGFYWLVNDEMVKTLHAPTVEKALKKSQKEG